MPKTIGACLDVGAVFHSSSAIHVSVHQSQNHMVRVLCHCLLALAWLNCCAFLSPRWNMGCTIDLRIAVYKPLTSIFVLPWAWLFTAFKIIIEDYSVSVCLFPCPPAGNFCCKWINNILKSYYISLIFEQYSHIIEQNWNIITKQSLIKLNRALKRFAHFY